MSNISTQMKIALINTNKKSGVITLPDINEIPYRSMSFKDYYGSLNYDSTVTLSTSQGTLFENGLSSMTLNTKYDNVILYGDSIHNKWLTLNHLNNSGSLYYNSESIKSIDAPMFDLLNCCYNSNTGEVTLSWFPVSNADYYKVFGTNLKSKYLNLATKYDSIIKTRSLQYPFFNYDSGVLHSNTLTLSSNDVISYNFRNFYVFSYTSNNRSSFPKTELFWGGSLALFNAYKFELCAIPQVEYKNGSNFSNYTDIKFTNLYTNETLTLGSNVFNSPPYDGIQWLVPMFYDSALILSSNSNYCI